MKTRTTVGMVILLLGASLIATGCWGGSSTTDSEGKKLTDSKCTACHSADHWTSQRHTRSEWMDIIQEMEKYGAKFTGDEKTKIADYLSQEYGK